MNKLVVKKYRVVAKAPDVMGNGRMPKDLVSAAWDMLQASADSAEAYSHELYTAERFKHAKLTLGFLNATINSIKTSMQFVKMVTMPQEVKDVEKMMKRQLVAKKTQ